jgi:hypothetical protein
MDQVGVEHAHLNDATPSGGSVGQHARVDEVFRACYV